MDGRLVLDVVIRQGAAILELPAGKDEAQLVGRDVLLVLDLRFDAVNCFGRQDLEGDGLRRIRLGINHHGSAWLKLAPGRDSALRR